MDAEIGTLEIGGQTTRMHDAGSGDAVVVLHGWGGRMESVTPIINCLVPEFRVVALDLPGFGQAPAPSDAWGTPRYADFVKGVLDHLKIGKAHFVGHSFGAKTSLCVAAMHPQVVGKLVVVGSSGLRTPPSMKARAKRLTSRAVKPIARFGKPGQMIRDAVFDRIASQDYKEAGPMRPTLVKVVNEDLKPLLPRISAPTLLVWGTKDDAVPLAHARVMEKMIPDAGLVTFEGAGHFAYLDEPERFCRVVQHFLRPPVTT